MSKSKTFETYYKNFGADFVVYLRAVLAKREQIENAVVEPIDGEPVTQIVIPDCGADLNFGVFDLGKEVIDNYFEFNRIRSCAFYALLEDLGYSQFFPIEKTAKAFSKARYNGTLYKNPERWVMIQELADHIDVLVSTYKFCESK